MKLLLLRFRNDGDCVIGKLYLDGKFECYTLEPFLNNKLAIAVGEYRVTCERSPRLGFITPRLHNVPQRTGILIHSGNQPKHSKGCILVGKTEKKSWVGSSKDAFHQLLGKLQQSQDAVSIRVQNADTLQLK